MMTVTIDDAQVMAALEKLRARVQNTKPALTDIGEELVSRILEASSARRRRMARSGHRSSKRPSLAVRAGSG
ncbi:MAG: hypothetical protein CUN48_18465, partial [Candidatus Thermofonsia Clade 3 bacterium]